MNEVLAVTASGIGKQFHGNVLDMIFDAGPMVQFVLFLLLSFSVISWAIILMKYRMIRRSKKENELFIAAYMRSSKLSSIFPESKKFRYATIAEVFRAGYTELGKLAGAKREHSLNQETTDEGSFSLELRGVDNIERALNRACDSEMTKLESTLGFLATTGSACPFIGLFGTVWGIMNAFKGIGVRGSATLSVVAPGISEALIATAAGLAAAIPAVIFYNYYLSKIRAIGVETENFSSEFLNIIERFYVRNIESTRS
ncbi:MAG: protein TolQ [Syntrophales bacterium]|nr:protein TolQ [Syntrophales bacterium]MDY0044553.1 protein TolQ [Syntrophales bacterium]